MGNRHRIVLVVTGIMLCLLLTGCGPKVFNDGTYIGISTADDHGYAVAEVTIKDDKIADVKFTEYTQLAVPKDMETYPWEPTKQANAEMPARFIGRQDANVDTISGATGSCIKYINAVEHALEKARKKPQITTKYFDGTFMGRSEADDHGYGIAYVTIEGDKITSVRLLEVTAENQFKDFATYPWPATLEAKEYLEKAFVEKNGPDVDTYAGATGSSRKWIEAVTNALQNAQIR